MKPAFSAAEEQAPSARGDEVSPILEFLIREMVFNASSQHADRIREYNVMARQDCQAEYKKLPLWARIFGGTDFLESCQQSTDTARFLAEGEWCWLVREDGLWDHRRHIREIFRLEQPTSPEQRSHHYAGFLYPHELWFHIHYGYVGKACGFLNAELLDGAGSRPAPRTGSLSRAAPESGRLRRFDNPADREAISIGLRLYPFVPTTAGLLNTLETTPGLARKPLPK
jgi:hypothetical protein